ncbi:MAG: hypothetical protein ACLP0J_26135 [Solirubrobacteraceae bacterium]
MTATAPVDDTSCQEALYVPLSSAINGRAILGDSWPGPLRHGAFRDHVLGVPRLLGLDSANARRVLWLEGFPTLQSTRRPSPTVQRPAPQFRPQGTSVCWPNRLRHPVTAATLATLSSGG